MQPRPYQAKALTCIIGEFEKGIQRTLIAIPTGTGKTIIFNGIGYYFAYNEDRTPTGKKVLVLAHQNILIDQAADKFQKAVGVQVSREKGNITCLDSPYPITVSSVQTMSRRLEKFDPHYFDLIIIDEAHHSESKQYKKVLDHFKNAKVLGVTATPDRADEKKLSAFQSVAFQYSIEEAQRDGYLAPITLERAAVEIDLSKVKRKKGDFLEKDLGSAIDPYLEEIAKYVRPITHGRKIICFVPLISTARLAEERFSHYGFKTASISGEESKAERERILKDFEEGKYDIIFNAILLTEGYDCPQIDCVIVLRPTTSRALYVQMVGRGLRLAQGKKDCLLIDFLFQHEGFDLAGPEDVLGIEAKEKLSFSKTHGQGHGHSKEVETPEERLARKLLEAAQKLKRELAKVRDLYPTLEAETQKENSELGLKDGPMSEEQEDQLLERGLDPTGLSWTEAGNLLKQLKEKDPPSSSQAWRLRQLGFSEEALKRMTFAEAKKELKRQKAMGRW